MQKVVLSILLLSSLSAFCQHERSEQTPKIRQRHTTHFTPQEMEMDDIELAHRADRETRNRSIKELVVYGMKGAGKNMAEQCMRVYIVVAAYEVGSCIYQSFK